MLILLCKAAQILSVISGFGREVDEICAFLVCYGVYNSNSLLTFRDNVSVTYSRVKKLLNFLALEDGTDR